MTIFETHYTNGWKRGYFYLFIYSTRWPFDLFYDEQEIRHHPFNFSFECVWYIRFLDNNYPYHI